MKGYIILVENLENSFISKAIKFFTKHIAKKGNVPVFTHACYGIGKVLGIESVISAEEVITVMPFERIKESNCNYYIYRINDAADKKLIDYSLSHMYKSTAGKGYGFWQLLWFIYRWFMEHIGFNVKHKKNWFPTGDICSENTYRYLMTRFTQQPITPAIAQVLVDLLNYTENTIHPVDLAIIIKNNPQVFVLTEQRSSNGKS